MMFKSVMLWKISLVLLLVGCDSSLYYTVRSNADVSEQSWMGEQRRQLMDEVWTDVKKLASSTFTKDCMHLELNENKISQNLTSMVLRFENRCSYHTMLWRKSRLVDEQTKQVLQPKELYQASKYAQLLNDVRALYRDFALQNANQGWRGIPKNDDQREIWLDEYVQKSVDNNLTIRMLYDHEKSDQSTEQWHLEFCSDDFAVDNHYFACVHVPALKYVSEKYLPEIQ